MRPNDKGVGGGVSEDQKDKSVPTRVKHGLKWLKNGKKYQFFSCCKIGQTGEGGVVFRTHFIPVSVFLIVPLAWSLSGHHQTVWPGAGGRSRGSPEMNPPIWPPCHQDWWSNSPDFLVLIKMMMMIDNLDWGKLVSIKGKAWEKPFSRTKSFFCCPRVLQHLSNQQKVQCHRNVYVFSEQNKNWRFCGGIMEVIYYKDSWRLSREYGGYPRMI